MGRISMAEWAAYLIHFEEVLGSDIDPKTYYNN
jgi:hypothetical protein